VPNKGEVCVIVITLKIFITSFLREDLAPKSNETESSRNLPRHLQKQQGHVKVRIQIQPTLVPKPTLISLHYSEVQVMARF
jgi:hypothetical protein